MSWCVYLTDVAPQGSDFTAWLLLFQLTRCHSSSCYCEKGKCVHAALYVTMQGKVMTRPCLANQRQRRIKLHTTFCFMSTPQSQLYPRHINIRKELSMRNRLKTFHGESCSFLYTSCSITRRSSEASCDDTWAQCSHSRIGQPGINLPRGFFSTKHRDTIFHSLSAQKDTLLVRLMSLPHRAASPLSIYFVSV